MARGGEKSVFIVEDHGLTRLGLRTLVDEDEALRVAGESRSAADAINRLRMIACDLILLDIGLGAESGLTSIAEFRRLKPDIKILVLTMHSDWVYLKAAVDAGADGYLLKTEDPDQVREALHRILNNERVFPEAVEAILPDHNEDERALLATLTVREREVLGYVAQAFRNKEIAERLHLSVRTVESHRSSIMEKFGVGNSAELVRLAVRLCGPA
ncbi:MAG: response regulator transcription factor [bacterium]|nr:response regulator transcription factor [bacterium]